MPCHGLDRGPAPVAPPPAFRGAGMVLPSVVFGKNGAKGREGFFQDPRRDEGVNPDSRPRRNAGAWKKTRGFAFSPRAAPDFQKILSAVLCRTEQAPH